jgi:hypothetical protein
VGGYADKLQARAGGLMEAGVRSAVGLTDRRLLIFDYTLTGKPKDLVAQFPLDQVAPVSVRKGLTNQVSFGFNDGSAVEVECAKLERVGDFEVAFQGIGGTCSEAERHCRSACRGAFSSHGTPRRDRRSRPGRGPVTRLVLSSPLSSRAGRSLPLRWRSTSSA